MSEGKEKKWLRKKCISALKARLITEGDERQLTAADLARLVMAGKVYVEDVYEDDDETRIYLFRVDRDGEWYLARVFTHGEKPEMKPLYTVSTVIHNPFDLPMGRRMFHIIY